MQPEHVAPLILWLCHEDCNVTGQLFECGGGWMAQCKYAALMHFSVFLKSFALRRLALTLLQSPTFLCECRDV